MSKRTRNLWVLAVVGGALAQALGTYLVRLLDWAGPVVWVVAVTVLTSQVTAGVVVLAFFTVCGVIANRSPRNAPVVHGPFMGERA
jgi:hypothetical protein